MPMIFEPCQISATEDSVWDAIRNGKGRSREKIHSIAINLSDVKLMTFKDLLVSNAF